MITRFDFKFFFFFFATARVGTKSSDEALVKPLVLSQCASFVLPNRLQIQVPTPFGTAHAPSLTCVSLSKTERATSWNIKTAPPQWVITVFLCICCSLEFCKRVCLESCFLCIWSIGYRLKAGNAGTAGTCRGRRGRNRR